MQPFHRLIHDNVAVLRQGIEVVEALDAETYARPDPRVDSRGIGSHIRHCIDYYSRLLDDHGGGEVDFDARGRDPAVETDPAVAADRFRRTITALESLRERDGDTPLRIRMDSRDDDGSAPVSISSLGREVHGLLTHTIHHFAIVALLLRLDGRAVPEGFGVAPSTLRFWKETHPSASVDS